MEIRVHAVPEAQQKPLPPDPTNIPFGTVFTDHMFLMEWDAGEGWHDARIQAYQPLELEPSALVFHYSPEAFEGLKAYSTTDGQQVLFRPTKNFERMNMTARRMCLAELDEAFVLKALKQLLQTDRRWIPQQEGASLYIRPTLIGVEPALGLKVSKKFLFFIIMCPVGPYYAEGFNPVKIKVSEDYVRSVRGGVGDAKTGGNYAAATLAEKKAKEAGYTQVLWLDGVERKYVEEVGSMNLFFVINDELVTPELTGTILPGVTRDSVLKLAKHWNMPTSERRVTIQEVVDAIQDGSLTEVFGAGTAAVISPVGALSYQGKEYAIGDQKTGPVAQRFFDHVTGMQYGKEADPFGWIVSIDS